MHARPKQVDRVVRVGEFLRREIGDLIRTKLRDPRIDGVNVSVNDVRVTRDLAFADIYVSCVTATTGEDRQLLTDCLNAAAGFLRTGLAGRNSMRTTPLLRFQYDEVEERANHIEDLIAAANKRESHGT